MKNTLPPTPEQNSHVTMPVAPQAPKRNRKYTVLLIIGLLILAIAGSSAATYFLTRKNTETTSSTTQSPNAPEKSDPAAASISPALPASICLFEFETYIQCADSTSGALKRFENIRINDMYATSITPSHDLASIFVTTIDTQRTKHYFISKNNFSEFTEVTELTGKEVATPSWSFDQKTILVDFDNTETDNGALYSYNIDSRELKKLPVNGRSSLPILLSGNRLLYIGYEPSTILSGYLGWGFFALDLNDTAAQPKLLDLTYKYVQPFSLSYSQGELVAARLEDTGISDRRLVVTINQETLTEIDQSRTYAFSWIDPYAVEKYYSTPQYVLRYPNGYAVGTKNDVELVNTKDKTQQKAVFTSMTRGSVFLADTTKIVEHTADLTAKDFVFGKDAIEDKNGLASFLASELKPNTCTLEHAKSYPFGDFYTIKKIVRDSFAQATYNGICGGGAAQYYVYTNASWQLAFGTQNTPNCDKVNEFKLPGELIASCYDSQKQAETPNPNP